MDGSDADRVVAFSIYIRIALLCQNQSVVLNLDITQVEFGVKANRRIVRVQLKIVNYPVLRKQAGCSVMEQIMAVGVFREVFEDPVRVRLASL